MKQAPTNESRLNAARASTNRNTASPEVVEIRKLRTEWEEVTVESDGRTVRRTRRLEISNGRFQFRTVVVVVGAIMLLALLLRPEIASGIIKEGMEVLRSLGP